ncbi:MAG: YHS domain-containing protein [Pseudomonadota bacterium]
MLRRALFVLLPILTLACTKPAETPAAVEPTKAPEPVAAPAPVAQPAEAVAAEPASQPAEAAAAAVAFPAELVGTSVKDPVCNMDVTVKADSLHSEHEGKHQFFCSANCKESFDKDPGKYAAK